MRDQIASLSLKRDEVKQKLAALHDLSTQTWQAARCHTLVFFDDLHSAIERVTARLSPAETPVKTPGMGMRLSHPTTQKRRNFITHEMIHSVMRTAPVGPFVATTVLALPEGVVLPFALILKKAGYSPRWDLLAVLPIAPLVLVYFFALGNWPRLHVKNS